MVESKLRTFFKPISDLLISTSRGTVFGNSALKNDLQCETSLSMLGIRKICTDYMDMQNNILFLHVPQ